MDEKDKPITEPDSVQNEVVNDTIPESNQLPSKKRNLFSKKRIGIGLVVIFLICVAAIVLVKVLDTSTVDSNTTQQYQNNEGAVVSISSSGVMPTTVTIKKGQTVTWKNEDTNEHQIAADPYPTNESLPDLGKGEVLQPGDSFTFIYENTGTYSYHDNLYPYDIKGIVVVED